MIAFANPGALVNNHTFSVTQQSALMIQDRPTFYTNPKRGQVIRWTLEEVGVPYDTVLLDYGTTMKAPDYLVINPMGKVPAIRHGDTS